MMPTSVLVDDLTSIVKFLTESHKIGSFNDEEIDPSYFATSLTKISSKNAQLIGSSPSCRACIWEWLEHRVQADVDGIENFAKKLNQHLQDCVYIVGHSITLADVVAFYALHPFLCGLTQYDRQTTYTNVCRWIENIQECEGIINGLTKFMVLHNHVYN